MTQNEHINSTAEAGMPKEIVSTINLFAHPMAGVAAAGAVGLGIASQAFGMWLGALAGATEASRKMFDAPDEAAPAAPVERQVAKLRLVEKAVAAPAPAKAAPRNVAAATSKDDLKAINGIGPKLEKVLNGLGIQSFAQIAALDADAIAGLNEKLGLSGRIERDDWVGQAQALTARN